MSRNLPALIALGLLTVLASGPLGAADSVDSNDARLRETLRSTLLQLTAAENDRAALQAAQAENDEKAKALAKQVEALAKQGSADRAAAAQTTAALTSRVADQNSEISRLKDNIAKLTAAGAQSAASAQALEIQRAKLAEENILLQRRVSDCEMRNAALFKLGNEILVRYRDFSLGNALSAKEPFVGITRVKLENLAQSYQDKLLDQKISQ